MPSAFACSDARVWGRRSLILVALIVGLGAGACVRGGGGTSAPASRLEISAVEDADVWVDGQYIGQVAAVSGRLELAPGVHRVEIRKPGHFPVQRTVRVDKKGGEVLVVTADLLEDPR